MATRYRHGIYSWATYERRTHDFSSALFCVAAGMGLFVGMLTLSSVWATATVACVVWLAYALGLKRLIDRQDALVLVVQAGVAANLVVAPIAFSPATAPALAAFHSSTRVSTLLLSFGIVASLWFLWQLFALPAAFEREGQKSEDNRSGVVSPGVLLLVFVMIMFGPALALRASVPELLLLHGLIGMFAAVWVGTGSAFLWFTLR
jgi:hypothetical protein